MKMVEAREDVCGEFVIEAGELCELVGKCKRLRSDKADLYIAPLLQAAECADGDIDSDSAKVIVKLVRDVEEAKAHHAIAASNEYAAQLHAVYRDPLVNGVRRRGMYALVIEHIEGYDLLDLLLVARKSALREHDVETRELFVQALRALQLMHAQGWAHLDVKPENFVYQESARKLRLIDFGFSRRTTPSAGPTYTSSFCTLQYVAPEVATTFRNTRRRSSTSTSTSTSTSGRKAYDERVDVFSLGMTFAVLLLGRLPYASLSGKRHLRTLTSAQLAKIEQVAVEYTDAQLRKLSPTCMQFLSALLEQDPAKRATPAQALAHPFLRDITEKEHEGEDEVEEVEDEVEEEEVIVLEAEEADCIVMSDGEDTESSGELEQKKPKQKQKQITADYVVIDITNAHSTQRPLQAVPLIATS